MTRPQDPIMTQNEVIVTTRICRMTIYRYRRAGKFPPGFKHAEKLVWRESAITDYLHQIETTGRWLKR